jgi:multicomponent K+:H+ antiporter subunit G
MELVHEILVSALIVIGTSFALVGSWGLVRLPDLPSRLHAPTKATTLGIGGALLASMLHAFVLRGELSFHELAITLFLFLTAPITAHFLAKAWLHRHGDPAQLPPPAGAQGWSTFDGVADEAVSAGAGDGETGKDGGRARRLPAAPDAGA